MAKIKKIPKSKIKNLKAEIQLGFETNLIKSNPMIVDLLQNNRQIYYASYDSNELLGAISLYSEGLKKTKWEYKGLYIGDFPHEITKKLINYTVNKYGGAGAERFVVYIPERYNQLIELLKKECMFRGCGDIDVFKKNIENYSDEFPQIALQDFKEEDTVPLLELYNYCLFPQFRQSLSTDKNYWKKRLAKACDKKVLYISNIMEGYYSLHNPSENVFYADILMSEFYQSMYNALVQYAIAKVKSINPKADLYFAVKKFHQSSKNYLTVMKDFQFELDESYATMVRDYWDLIKQNTKEEKASSLLFDKMGSPA